MIQENEKIKALENIKFVDEDTIKSADFLELAFYLEQLNSIEKVIGKDNNKNETIKDDDNLQGVEIL